MKKLLFILIYSLLSAMPATTSQISFKQPNGIEFSGFVRGDEWQHWHETVDGFTIAQNEISFWVYVENVNRNGFVLTDIFAHSHSTNLSQSIAKHIQPSRQEITDNSPIPNIQLRTEFEVPLILVDYPNMEHSYPLSNFNDLMNQEGYESSQGATGSFKDFYNENSYGQFDPNVTVFGWFRADEDYQNYGDNAPNGWNMVRQLIAEAVDDAEEQGVDWSMFDNDGDGYVDALNVVHAGPGAEEGNSSYIWSHKWSLGSYSRNYDGVVIDSYTINPEQTGSPPSASMVHIGVFCHEFGHALGLPDLYDIDYSSSGIGTWGLMSGGSWGGNGGSPWYPSHFSAWSKTTLGWVDAIEITDANITLDMDPVEFNPVIFKMSGLEDENQYFLFENRQKIGFDQTLRGSGLLIWHIDDNVSCSGNGCNSDEWHRRVDLEQADGNFNLNYGTNNGDSYDIWPGLSGNTEFNDGTTPNSKYYNENPSGASVYNIQENDGIVIATFRNHPTLVIESTNIVEVSGDGDSVANPGETIELFTTLFNPSDEYIQNVSGVVSSNDSEVSIIGDFIDIPNMNPMEYTNIADGILLEISEDAGLGFHSIELFLLGEIDGEEFEQSITIEFEITINQQGFPFINNQNVKSSPLVLDFNNDGNEEIIWGSMDGFVYATNSVGEMLEGNWPFDTGNQIWAPIAGEDLDGDGNIELVVLSKSKHAFILDSQGNVVLDVETDEFLISAPVIGNMDTDDDLEVAFATMNNGIVYAINMDGSFVHENFPLELDEKVYADLALADFNNNGKDDIIVATSSNDGYVFVILDDGNIAEGFPYFVDDKFRSAPLIVNAYGNNELQIVIGNDNGKIYCINKNGSVIFEVQTDDKIRSAPSTNGVNIFVSNEGGQLYSINTFGEINSGWPIESNNKIFTPIFADIDLNGVDEIVTISESGDVLLLNSDGSENTDFSMNINSQIDDCPPAISDIDNDGDLEFITGMTTGLYIVDLKNLGNQSEWNLHRGNARRTGYWSTPILPEITMGDVNFDSELNVLDVVIVVNSILEIEPLDSFAFYIADMNADGIVNVLDILEIVIILMA